MCVFVTRFTRLESGHSRPLEMITLKYLVAAPEMAKDAGTHPIVRRPDY